MVFEYVVDHAIGQLQAGAQAWQIEVAGVPRPVPAVPRPGLAVPVDDPDPGRRQLVVERLQVFADHRSPLTRTKQRLSRSTAVASTAVAARRFGGTEVADRRGRVSEGVVPGSNIGDDAAVVEAVHGSAPDLAGRNATNPLAVIISGVMMLEAHQRGRDREEGPVRLRGGPVRRKDARAGGKDPDGRGRDHFRRERRTAYCHPTYGRDAFGWCLPYQFSVRR
jgi:hypothetical protein